MPELLTSLSPAPIVFLVIFLLISPVSKLVLPQDEAGAAATDVRSRTPVVLVVMDEFDANMLMNAQQRIDGSRYPNFAALARTATWYRNATTVATSTTDAVPALLSSTRPRQDALPVAADYPNNVFTLLAESHSLHVQEPTTALCPERLCGARRRDPGRERLGSLAEDLSVVSLHLLLPEGLRSDLPAVDRTFADFRSGGRDDEKADSGKSPSGKVPSGKAAPEAFHRGRKTTVDELLSEIRPREGRPALHFLHAAYPHIPWQYLPSGQQYLSGGPDTPGLEDERWTDEEFPPRLGMQRHLLQVGYTDRVVGRVVDRLRRARLFDSALVIFTADHGVSYRPGGPRRAIVRENRSDIAAVPLFIKYPRQRRGRIDTSMVRNVDVLPTIAEQLGTRLKWDAIGRPIRSGGPQTGRVEVFGGPSGEFVKLSFTEFVRERSAGLKRMIRLFGADDGGEGLYATGPDRDLLGKAIAGLAVGRGPVGRVNLDSTELLAGVRRGATTVPSFVTGRIDGDVQDGARLAVAVNGVVRGVSVAFPHDGDIRVAAMVPAHSFGPGANEVDVYVAQGRGGERRLSRLETERPSAGYRLVKDGTAIATGGREIPVVKGRLEGFIDGIVIEGGSPTFVVGGWAVDRRAGRPVEKVVVFDGSRFITDADPTVERPDLVKGDPRLAGTRPGFRFNPTARGVSVSDIRVFAVSGDVATELRRFRAKKPPAASD